VDVVVFGDVDSDGDVDGDGDADAFGDAGASGVCVAVTARAAGRACCDRRTK
jgi:hypothetical protein